MAGSSRKRRSPLGSFLEDIIDDAKDLTDDLVDRVKDVEHSGRKVVRKAVGDDDDKNSTNGNGSADRSRTSGELDDLKASIAQLTAMVNELAVQEKSSSNGA